LVVLRAGFLTAGFVLSIFGAGFVAVFSVGFALVLMFDLTGVFALFIVVEAMAVPVKRKALAVKAAISLFKLVLLLSAKIAPGFQTEAGRGGTIRPCGKCPFSGKLALPAADERA
jgi:hypothetical protein